MERRPLILVVVSPTIPELVNRANPGRVRFGGALSESLAMFFFPVSGSYLIPPPLKSWTRRSPRSY